MRKVNYYRYPHPHNVGDTLTPHILKHFTEGIDFRLVRESASGKFIGVGSIMRVIQPGDTIWGAGVMRVTDRFPQGPQCNFLAVRGKLSKAILEKDGAEVPDTFGDPALLLPLMFKPEVTKTHKVGIIPHFVDTHLITQAKGDKLAEGDDWKLIDVFLDYQSFISEVLSCERIVSSSLHGIVIAEAYGIPAEWVVLSNRVIGDGFKFKDYLTGTGREIQEPGKFPPIEQDTLRFIQEELVRTLHSHFNSHNETGQGNL